MKLTERYSDEVVCPTCKRTTQPWIVEHVPAMDAARPPIPARVVLLCAHDNCKTPWYGPELDGDTDREENAAEAQREGEGTADRSTPD